MNLQENRYGWLAQTSAASTFDNDKEYLGKSLENEVAYMGKKLTTNNALPECLCRFTQYTEFYRDVLHADKKVLKMVSNGHIVPFDSNLPPTHVQNNKSCLRSMDFAVQ